MSSKTEIGLAFKEHTVWADVEMNVGDVEMNQIVTLTKVTLQL